MTILLTVGATVVTLHPDLYWDDETSWQPVQQTTQRTLTGALIVSLGTRITGRSITLRPEDDGSAWMSLSALTQLRNWAGVAGQQMQLTLKGVTRTVLFRHHEGPALEAVPVVHFSEMETDDFYRITLRLMEI